METNAFSPLWPLWVFGGITAATVGGMIAVSFVLGQRHRGRVTDDPYESGMPPTGTVDARLSVRYYLMALFFVVFDVEILFLFAWAVAARTLGWPAYGAAVVFIGILLLALLYLGKNGAFDWGSPRRRAGQDRRGTS